MWPQIRGGVSSRVEIQVTQEGSVCFSFTFLPAMELEASVDCSVRVVLCQKSPSVRQIEGIINSRSAGRRTEGPIKCWIVVLLIVRQEAAPSLTALACPADPLFVSCHGDKHK